MTQHKSMIDPELPVEHDYNFLNTFCTAFETLNPGSIAKIYTTEVNDEERWSLYTLCSMDSNVNLVCLAHCLYDKENQEGYDRLLGHCVYFQVEDSEVTC